MKDGKVLTSGGGRFQIVYTLGICSLEVAVCEPSDAGKYTCVAENSQGTEESTCKVTVNGTRPSSAGGQFSSVSSRSPLDRFRNLSSI